MGVLAVTDVELWFEYTIPNGMHIEFLKKVEAML